MIAFPHKTSAGIIIQTAESNKIFLGHSRNSVAYKPLGQCLQDTHWTIPKGTLEPGETPLNAALREVYEESGIAVYDWLPPHEQVVYFTSFTTANHSKLVHVFRAIVHESILHLTPVCNSLVERPDVPWVGLSELDNFGWFTEQEAHDHVVQTQKSLFKGHVA